MGRQSPARSSRWMISGPRIRRGPIPARRGCTWTALVLFATLGASLTLAAASLSGWSFRNWQLDQGLPNNFVVGTARTSDGYLWVATRLGLARFDGVRFEPVASADFFDGTSL